MGPAAVTGEGLSQGKFAREIETEQYKQNLYRHLISQGVNENTANIFIKKVGLISTPRSFGAAENISQRMQFGATKIIDKNSTKDFFEQHSVIEKYLPKYSRLLRLDYRMTHHSEQKLYAVPHSWRQPCRVQPNHQP